MGAPETKPKFHKKIFLVSSLEKFLKIHWQKIPILSKYPHGEFYRGVAKRTFGPGVTDVQNQEPSIGKCITIIWGYLNTWQTAHTEDLKRRQLKRGRVFQNRDFT